MKDPILHGKEIFNEVVKPLTWNETSSLKEAKELLSNLISATKGLMIVDFLDSGNWDCVESVEIDERNGFLQLNWHDYRTKKESDEDKEMRSYAFPAALYSALIKFRELRILNVGKFPLFLIRGYALKDKEIKKYLDNGKDEFKILNNYDNFSKLVLTRTEKVVETHNCLTTPIFSMIILPKNIGVSSAFSQAALFDYNLNDSIERITNVQKELETKEKMTEDEICEKANSIRRIFEYVLKVELCYRYRQVNVKKDYSDLMLGDLANLIKPFRETGINDFVTRIIIWSNELSHDSGKPIKKELAIALSYMTRIYTELLKSEIKINPYPKN